MVKGGEYSIKRYLYIWIIILLIIGVTTLIFLKGIIESQDEKSELIDFSNAGEEESDDVSTSQIIPWGITAIGGPFPVSNQTKKIKVAILDSGINKNHPDLRNKVVKEFNAINPKDPVIDDYGHGTAIAGIIAANDNSEGVIGVSQNALLYSVKVLDKHGNGNIDTLVKAISWCIKNKVDIINLSFGLTNDNEVLYNKIKEANKKGIIIVAAAGNNIGLKTDYPARYKEVISVNPTNKEYKYITELSSKGKIDYTLPGVQILTTTKDGKYAEFEGSSIATAYLTGLLAVLLGDKDKYSINNENYLSSINKHSYTLGSKELFGNGFIKIDKKGSK